MSNGNSFRKKASSIDEVEELLRSAQDDILLKLSLNSHIALSGTSSQTSSSTIDPDLDRRFEALKSKPKLSTESRSESESDKKNSEKEVDNIDESDNLFARLAALKNSIPSYSNAGVVGDDTKISSGEKYESADEEDEVEKMINWAIDAARLDPSPPSDADTVDSEKDSDSENDSDDEDNHKVDSKRK